MQGSEFDEDAFFQGIARVRALLIGRRALIALGIPDIELLEGLRRSRESGS